MICKPQELNKARTGNAGARAPVRTLEAKGKKQQQQARRAMMAILDGEIAEWSARLSAALDTVRQRSAFAGSGSCLTITPWNARYRGIRRKKLPALKQADSAALGEMQ